MLPLTTQATKYILMNSVQVINSQLTLQNMGGCFIILAAGICLAVLISILTILSKNMNFNLNKKH